MYRNLTIAVRNSRTGTQTESQPDLSDLVGKYAFGDVGKEGKEKK
jgi:hypothetical protein